MGYIRQKRLGTVPEVFLVLHQIPILIIIIMVHERYYRVERDVYVRSRFVCSCPCFSSRGRCPLNRRAGMGDGGCLLDCGRWGLNRAVLCAPAEVGSVGQDQNT